uniref:Uncharacterized protein n=1 Tax=Leptocylindrus danicus TaxID=163516 RepID=A0A7S2KI31_9STRA
MSLLSNGIHEDKWHCEYCNAIPPIFQVKGGTIASGPGRSKHLKECNGGRPSVAALVQICNLLKISHPSFSAEALISVPFIKFINSIVGQNLALTSLFTLDVASQCLGILKPQKKPFDDSSNFNWNAYPPRHISKEESYTAITALVDFSRSIMNGGWSFITNPHFIRYVMIVSPNYVLPAEEAFCLALRKK